jgi:hypothetical protein
MKEGGLFWPVFLILVGTAILLVNLGILPPETWRFWPVILIIPGLLKLSGFGMGEEKKK